MTPPLATGQRMDRATFHARYLLAPPKFHAELVDGVVFVRPPRVGDDHGAKHSQANYWLACYEGDTPGVAATSNGTTILGPADEVQPDAALRVHHGGRSAVRPDGFIGGCPELACEVADARTESHDLHAKRRAYATHGAVEYVAVVLTAPRRVVWWTRDGDDFRQVPPDADGLHRSRAFPGLWLDPAALLAGDVRRIAAVVETGVATAGHAAFVADLSARRA